jgi:hypothetical protein
VEGQNSLAGQNTKVKKMAVFTEKQRKLTRKLITILTGFTVSLDSSLATRLSFSPCPIIQPAEENFNLCFQFCKSNFQFHRFLSVNDLDVKRKVDG